MTVQVGSFHSPEAGATCTISVRCSTTRRACPIRHLIKRSSVQDHQRGVVMRPRMIAAPMRAAKFEGTTR
jgi:hypothetical protein